MEGLQIFTAHPVTGAISGSPHVGLRGLMPQGTFRSVFTVTCDVFPLVSSASIFPRIGVRKADEKLVIQVDSDNCWVDAYSYTDKTDGGLAWAGRISPEKGLEDALAVAARQSETLAIAGSIENKSYWDNLKDTYAQTIDYRGLLDQQGLQASWRRNVQGVRLSFCGAGELLSLIWISSGTYPSKRNIKSPASRTVCVGTTGRFVQAE